MILCLAAVSGALVGSSARAEDMALPVGLQVELLVKVAGYDRNMAQRAGDRVRVVILTRPGSDESAKVGAQVETALKDRGAIAGLPHEESIVPFVDARSLADLCRARRLAIVYVTPGFTDGEISAIAAALDGVDVFTAAALPSFVPRGIVLGFDLVSAKPKLLVHLGQARKQKVDLSADVLKLMKVYE
jgi:hypothetical protein